MNAFINECKLLFFLLFTHYRYTLGLGVFPSIAMCICLWFLFETPRWLVFHGKVDKAREVMRKIRSDDVVEKELGDIVNDYELTSKHAIGMYIFVYCGPLSSLAEPQA